MHQFVLHLQAQGLALSNRPTRACVRALRGRALPPEAPLKAAGENLGRMQRASLRPTLPRPGVTRPETLSSPLPTRYGAALVYGPVSAENRLYHSKCPMDQRSVTALSEALDRIGARWKVLNPCEPDFITELAGHDVALSNLHGPYGEDGRLQGLLDYLRLPYCGSGVAASRWPPTRARAAWFGARRLHPHRGRRAVCTGGQHHAGHVP
ncbi:hypothetical protein ACFXC8_51975 [Streptomyces sp. NPDC059441]|uniref:hypothetical protein n=1 Tax=Streptomyces sp. NPDC059441 TaxID=3346829 RepID=UPI0036ADACD7